MAHSGRSWSSSTLAFCSSIRSRVSAIRLLELASRRYWSSLDMRPRPSNLRHHGVRRRSRSFITTLIPWSVGTADDRLARVARAFELPVRLDATRQNPCRRSSAHENLLHHRTSLSAPLLRLSSAPPGLNRPGRPMCKAERLALENRMPSCGRRSSREREGADGEAQRPAPHLSRNQRQAERYRLQQRARAGTFNPQSVSANSF